MSKPENPPAFPPAIAVSASGDEYHGCDGMTLRDWFAGQALAGWLATYDGGTEHPAADDAFPHWVPNIAKASYRFADAMLAERSK